MFNNPSPASGISSTPHLVTRAQREQLHGHAGRVVWLTGLSGAGKSTLATALVVALHAQGCRTVLLDGDHLRQGLNQDLGFSKGDRNENVRRVAEVARLFVDAGTIVIAALISPLRAQRRAARALFKPGDFLEVFVDVPLSVAEERDPKGLYRKARSGQLHQFTGISSPYEPPIAAELVIHTHLWSENQSVDSLLALLGMSCSPSPTASDPSLHTHSDQFLSRI